MKKTFVIKLLLFIMLSACLVNCSRNKVVNGIVVSELLLSVSKEQHVNYCKLLKEATTNDANSIKRLTLLDFYDGVSYDHSAVIVDLIYLIGEDKFIQSLGIINEEQKNKISSYLMAGLEYGNNPNLQGKTVKEAFPKVYIFLN